MIVNCSVFCDVQHVRSSILIKNVMFGKFDVQTFNVQSVWSLVLPKNWAYGKIVKLFFKKIDISPNPNSPANAKHSPILISAFHSPPQTHYFVWCIFIFDICMHFYFWWEYLDSGYLVDRLSIRYYKWGITAISVHWEC